MTYLPVLPMGGVTGWRFLSSTLAQQRQAHQDSVGVARETNAFKERFGQISTAAELVADRDLLKVALGAFGLEEDLPNKAFIQKILEEGTLSSDALGNRLADTRYRKMAEAFGFGKGESPGRLLPNFAANIVASYQERDFERSVGTQNDDMRLVLNLKRELTDLATGSGTANGKWFSIMGQPPLRAVFEQAFGLPSSFGALDIDQQLTVFRDRAESVFGDGEIAQFADSEKMDKLISRFLIQSNSSVGFSATVPGAAALTLLQTMQGTAGLFG